jgi:hypothetical protein
MFIFLFKVISSKKIGVSKDGLAPINEYNLVLTLRNVGQQGLGVKLNFGKCDVISF